MELYLVRHGQSEANAGLTDSLDSDLTELGRLQADRTAERLRGEGLTYVYVSPLRRTLQTVAPICVASSLRAEIFADMCEYFSSPLYRDFPGLPPQEIRARYPFAYLGMTFPCDDVWWPQEVEDPDRMYARAERVRDALLRIYGHTEDRLLLVSHAEPIGRLIEALLRVPPASGEPPWTGNCGVSRLHCSPDPHEPAAAVYLNDMSHLAELPPS